MGKIPTILSQQGIKAAPVRTTPIGGPPSGGGIVRVSRAAAISPEPRPIPPAFGERAAAMFNLAFKNLTLLGTNLQDKAKKKKSYEEALWVEEADSSAQKQWMTWFSDVAKKPPDRVTEVFKEKFAEFESSLIEQAPSDEARLALQRSLNTLEERVLGKTLRLEAQTNTQNTVVRLNDLIQSASDIVAASNDPNMLFDQMAKLDASVDAALNVERISKEMAASFKNSINMLGADAAEHFASVNPLMARNVLDAIEGIPLTRRTAIENKIDRAIKTHDNLWATEQRELLQANLAQVRSTGSHNELFNLDRFSAATSKGEALRAKLDLQVAEAMYTVEQKMHSQSVGEISEIIDSLNPTAKREDNLPFNRQLRVQEQATRFGREQIELMTKDPFLYTLQDPVIKEIYNSFTNSDLEDKRHLRRRMIDVSLMKQEHLGIPKGRQSVMPRNEAVRLANSINNTGPDNVENEFMNLIQMYDKYYPEAFRELSRLPEGQRIDTSLQIVALHLGKPWLNDFIQATRFPSQDFKFDPATKKAFSERVANNKTLNSFKASIVANDIRNLDYANSFSDAIKQYAMSLFVRGKVDSEKDAVTKATELIIGNEYAFGSVNDEQYAIKKRYINKNNQSSEFTDREIKNIRKSLDLHLGRERQKGLRPILTFPSRINVDNISQDFFLFPETLNEKARKEAISDVVRNNAFWVTSPDNLGVTLWVPGLNGTSAPLLNKDGSEITVNFADALDNFDKSIRAQKTTATSQSSDMSQRFLDAYNLRSGGQKGRFLVGGQRKREDR